MNKVAALEAVGYEIRHTCGSCEHFRSFDRQREWGTCRATLYTHRKHTGEPREVSVMHYGHCPLWTRNPLVSFGTYSHFEED